MNATRPHGSFFPLRTIGVRTAVAALAACVGLGTGTRPAVAQKKPIPIAAVARQAPVDFEREILPILRRNCTACHSASDAQSDLNLESPESIRKGGDRGPAVVPKNPALSLLLKVASHQTDPAMPPQGNTVKAVPLTPQELGLIQAWIDEGAGGKVTGALTPTRWIPLPRPVQAIQAVALTQDGQFVAAGRGNHVVVHHVATGKLVADLVDPALAASTGAAPDPAFRPAAHLDLVQSLAFHPDGDLLASGAFREVKLWRRPRHVHVPLLAEPKPDVRIVAADRTGARIALATADRAIRVVVRATGAVAWQSTAHAGDVTALRFSSDGTRLLSGALDGTVRVWNAADGSALARLDAAHEVRAFATYGEGDGRLATGGGDEVVRVWSTPTGPAPVLAEAVKGTHRATAGGDRKRFATAAPTGDVQVFESATRSLIAGWKPHASAIEGIALNADGTRLVTAAADGTVVVWDVAAKQAVDAFHGTRGTPTHVAFSPDGKQLASAGTDGLVTVWSLARPALREIEPVAANAAAGAPAKRVVHRLVLSADGKRLATDDVVEGRGAIVVRDIESGRPIGAPLAGGAALGAFALSADGSRLACGAADKTVRLWKLEDGKYVEAHTHAGHGAEIACVAVSPDGNRIVSGDSAKSAKVWNAVDGTEIAELAGHAGAIVGVAFTNDNARIATASADKTVRLWTAADGKPQNSIALPAPATALSLAPDGTRVAVACADGSIRAFQISDGKPLVAIEGGAGTIRSLSFSSDGTRLVSAADGKDARLWDAATGRLLESFPDPAGVSAAVATPSAAKLLIAAGDGRLREASTAYVSGYGPTTPGDAKTPPAPITGLVWRNDGQAVVCTDAAGNLRAFTAANGQQVFTAAHGAPIRALTSSPDGQLLATGGDDRLVKLWSSNGSGSGTPLATEFKERVAAVAFSPDGTRIVVAGSVGGEAAVFDTASRRREQAFLEHAAGIESLATIGEGAGTIVSVAPTDAVRIWSPLLLRRITGHTQPVTALAALPGTPPQIVSGSADGTVRRWNGETGQAVANLNLGGPVRSIAVRPDGQRIAAAGENKLARLWNAANNQQTAELKGDFRAVALVGRLTQQIATSTARITAEKASLEAAEKDVPTKEAAAKTTATALAAADKDVAAKQEAAKKAGDAKTAAEKGAIEAAAVAQAAATAKSAADQSLADAKQAMQLAAAKSARATSLAAADPQNTSLAKQKADFEKALADANAAVTKATQAAAAAGTAFNDATTKANAATTAAVATNKPFTDAEAALRQAQAAQNRAAQADEVARRERDAVVALVPVRKGTLAAAEAELAGANKDLDAAKQRVADSEQPETAVAFSADGRLLALGGALKTIRTFDSETGVPVEAFDGHAAAIGALDFAADGALLSAAAGENAFAWDTNPAWVLERTIGRIDDPTVFLDRVLSVDFDRTGTLLATAGGIPSRNGDVKVWKVADGALVRALENPHSDVVHAVAFSPDGQFLATASADKFVRRFRLADGELVRTYEGHTEYVLGVAWRGNGRVLASCGADSVVNVWNVETGDRLRQIAGYRRQVTSVRFAGDTSTILSCSGDRSVRFHNSDNGAQVRTFAGCTDYVYSADVTPNGQYVAAGGYDGVLHLWNGTNAQSLHALQPPPVAGPEPTANGTAAPTGSGSR